MPLLGTVVNACMVVVGSLCGLLFRKGIPDRVQQALMQVIGLFTFVMGISLALSSQDMLVMLISLVVGTVIGEAIDIVRAFEQFSARLEQGNAGQQQESWFKAAVSATMLFCIGSMSILGAFQGGLEGDHSILFTKAVLDGTTSLLLTAAMGPGVLAAAISVLVYQGSLALAAGWLAAILSTAVITEMTAVGGVLLLALGLNMTGVAKLRVNNMMPALLLPGLVLAIQGWLIAVF